MKFITVRDLRLQAGDVWRQLREQQELVLTSNGRPIALLVDVSEEDLEATIAAFRRARAQQAVSAMQKRSAQIGTSNLSQDEIEAEIQQARHERQNKA